jgi:Arc/MetJ-type ribon-helix-helix transcriptional regulator
MVRLLWGDRRGLRLEDSAVLRQPKSAETGVTRSRVTVTVPSDVLAEAIAHVEGGRARSLSAYVSEALREKVVRDSRRDAYMDWLKQLDEELGLPSPQAYAWAREVLGLP